MKKSKLRQELDAAHLEIIKRRDYRGARESDVVGWLAEYVETNYVAKFQFIIDHAQNISEAREIARKALDGD